MVTLSSGAADPLSCRRTSSLQRAALYIICVEKYPGGELVGILGPLRVSPIDGPNFDGSKLKM